jgi:hypothetical protein
MQSWYLSEGCDACAAALLIQAKPLERDYMQCLQYIGDAMSELLIHADLGSAVAITVKTSVVKRVLESYAACSIQLAELVKKREDRIQHGDDAADVDALQKGAQQLHARGVAAHAAAAAKNVLAAKWLPP